MIPQLPTDNLYKFMALSGLALFISAGWLQYSIENAYIEQEAIVKGQIIAIIAEFEQGMTRLATDVGGKDLKAYITWSPIEDDNFEFVRPGSKLPILRNREARDGYRGGLANIDAFLADLEVKRHTDEKMKDMKWFSNEQLSTMRSDLRAHSVAVEQLWLRQDRTELIQMLSILAWVVGSILTILGFWFWYYRVQRHLDMALAVPAQKQSP